MYLVHLKSHYSKLSLIEKVHGKTDKNRKNLRNNIFQKNRLVFVVNSNSKRNNHRDLKLSPNNKS